jgi:hypothetical protein
MPTKPPDQRVEIRILDATPTRTGRVTRRSPQGILGGYIHDKLSLYEEPARTRAQKGQQVGFSRAKYHASLLALTCLDLQRMAQEARCTYGVLRVWRTEEGFKELVARHQAEFLGHFKLAVSVTFAANQARVRSKIEGDSEAIKRVAQRHLFDDAALYSRELFMLIISDWVDNAPSEQEDPIPVWTSKVGPFLAGASVINRMIELRKEGTPDAMRAYIARGLVKYLNWLLSGHEALTAARHYAAFNVSLALKLLYE